MGDHLAIWIVVAFPRNRSRANRLWELSFWVSAERPLHAKSCRPARTAAAAVAVVELGDALRRSLASSAMRDRCRCRYRPPPSSPLPFPRVMPLEPLLGGLLHDFGGGFVQPDGSLLDLPNDLRIHRRQELPFVALRGFSPLFLRRLRVRHRPARALCHSPKPSHGLRAAARDWAGRPTIFPDNRPDFIDSRLPIIPLKARQFRQTKVLE
jgi:hypothetical protein